MPYSHNKTLIAQLGFADPDRRDSKHFLACQYLATPKASLRLMETLGVSNRHPQSRVLCVEHEYRIGRGKDGVTTAGFADIVIVHENCHNVRKESTLVGSSGKLNLRPGERVISSFPSIDLRIARTYIIEVAPGVDTKQTSVTESTVLVEVKANPVSIDDLIRQMKFYQFHLEAAKVVVVTLFPIKTTDAATMLNEGINPYYLGEDFAMWCAESDTSIAVLPEA